MRTLYNNVNSKTAALLTTFNQEGRYMEKFIHDRPVHEAYVNIVEHGYFINVLELPSRHAAAVALLAEVDLPYVSADRHEEILAAVTSAERTTSMLKDAWTHDEQVTIAKSLASHLRSLQDGNSDTSAKLLYLGENTDMIAERCIAIRRAVVLDNAPLVEENRFAESRYLATYRRLVDSFRTTNLQLRDMKDL